MSKFVRAFILFLLLLLFDQLIKYFVLSQGLDYYKNYGFLFGLVSFRSLGISVLVVGVILIIIISSSWGPKGLQDPLSILDSARLASKWARMTMGKKSGWSLFLAGSISNILDRLLRGYVIDYLDWKIIFHFWPENFVRFFNLADVFIVVGLILLVYLRRSGGRDFYNLQEPF